MRRDLLACGIFVLFLGLVFQACSRVVVQPEPIGSWSVVDDYDADPPDYRLHVEGFLRSGETFKVYFSLMPPPVQLLPEDIGLHINVTDPQNDVTMYPIRVKFLQGKMVTMDPAPVATANYTGIHKIDAFSLWGINMAYLSLERRELLEQEPQYPYEVLYPASIAVLFGGVVVSLLGFKSSGKKRSRYKRRSSKRRR